jgi:hypothetical protein
MFLAVYQRSRKRLFFTINIFVDTGKIMKRLSKKNISLFTFYSFSLLICMLFVACEEGMEMEMDDSFEDVTRDLYLVGTRWPNNLTGTGASIPVCYRTPGAISGSTDETNRIAYLREVRGFIDQSWGRVANLNFTGWGVCASSNPAGTIRIDINTSGGSSCSLGYRGSNATNMELNMNDSRQPVVPIHEFGHALGFHHEFTRTAWQSTWGASIACTTSATCTDVNYGYTCSSGFCRWPGGTGLFDPNNADYDSVMASTYVNNYPNGNTTGVASPTLSLSSMDIVGVQALYGRKPQGSIVGDGNKCIDIHNPGVTEPSNSTYLQGYDCLGNANQDWNWIGNNSSGGDILKTSFTRGVMDVTWGNSTNGTALWNWTQNTSAAQRWRFEDIALVGMGGLCSDVQWGLVRANQPVWLWRCSKNYAQHWTVDKNAFTGKSVIRQTGGGGNNYCLTAKSGTGWQSVDLQLCDGRASQDWGFQDGLVVSTYGRCLDANGAVPQQGTFLGTFTCRTSSTDSLRVAQEFHLSGPIRGLASKCVDIHKVSGQSIVNGQKVQIWSCNGNTNQDWDFYF